MNHDINIKKLRLNCFRQSKVPGEFMLQMRVPGGMVDAKYLGTVQHIAQTWATSTSEPVRPLILPESSTRTSPQSTSTWNPISARSTSSCATWI